jgi:diadenosine tetraphosphate (Ap4A) HIT family hydrolase
VDTEGCLACDLASGRLDLPGGRIYATEHWVVEHCVGPLGVGTLIVKPLRHVLHLWELTHAEAAELGPLLQVVSSAVHELTDADQVHVCPWSFMGWTAGHIHFVVQPAWSDQQRQYERPGPFMQAAMFAEGIPPDRDEVAGFAERARALLERA